MGSKRNNPAALAAWEAVFDPDMLDDIQYWVETDRNTALRVLLLVRMILRDPFTGLGKPELLKSLGSGIWSRRITQEHRLLYRVQERRIYFLQARYHYSK